MLQEEKSELGKFIDLVKKKLMLSKIITTPRTFEDLNNELVGEISVDYYTLKICTDYLDELPKRIDKWIEIIDEYLGEFQGKWKYYAHSKRRDFINEYGGDEGDYDENGEIRMNLTDDELSTYHVLNEIVWNECRDIIQDSVPDNAKFILQYVIVDARIDIHEILCKVSPNNDIPSYRINEEGKLVENTPEDRVVNKIGRMVDADDICNMFTVVFYIICGIVSYIRKLQKEKIHEDCVGELTELRDNLKHLLAFEIDDVKSYISYNDSET